MTKPSRGPNLSVQVADQLRERICGGTWPVGTRIPTEHDLAQRLGIGRNSVREAVRSLVHAGLLEARAGDGTYVRSTSELAEVIRRRVDPSQLGELFEIRGALETLAARGAAERADPAANARIRRALERTEEAPSDEAFVSADADFHQAIADASGNALLADILRDLDGVASSMRALPSEVSLRALFVENPSLSTDHYALLEAIERGDPELARARAADLLAHARRHHDRADAAAAVPTEGAGAAAAAPSPTTSAGDSPAATTD